MPRSYVGGKAFPAPGNRRKVLRDVDPGLLLGPSFREGGNRCRTVTSLSRPRNLAPLPWRDRAGTHVPLSYSPARPSYPPWTRPARRCTMTGMSRRRRRTRRDASVVVRVAVGLARVLLVVLASVAFGYAFYAALRWVADLAAS